MPVVAVGRDEVIVSPAKGNRADRDGFLADVEVEETTDLSSLVVFQARLLESADPNHLREKFNFPLGAKRLVDG
jgi:carotenoid cleavage dioxygenase-like enzyme